MEARWFRVIYEANKRMRSICLYTNAYCAMLHGCWIRVENANMLPLLTSGWLADSGSGLGGAGVQQIFVMAEHYVAPCQEKASERIRVR